jgi:cytochrome c biogenesis protein CcdA/thiol-disulfide isomerase/thioredoxin
MTLLLVSFIAGALTVLAPCVLPLLPIIIGGAAQEHSRRNPYIITAALAISIVIFTLLLKFSTVFIEIPASTWSIISGAIIVAFGIFSLFPNLWTAISVKLKLQQSSDKMLEAAALKSGIWGDILLGASFGPVFSSCSPTYFVILATILPQSFGLGVVYLAVYAAGLSLVLLLISLLGQKFVSKIRWAANPNGWFKKSLGLLFVLVGIFILTGADKQLQTYLLEKGYFNVTNLEYKLLDEETGPDAKSVLKSGNYPPYQEIKSPSGFVNTEPITIGELIGKKVVLVDFMTYSCINCIRTLPYLNDWYAKYHDQGLEIIGIHTPEFAFEKDLRNVQAAMKKYDIKFPVVLDNDYATWNAYNNHYWPRKYLIDYDGNIVYDHIGEGGYTETETAIRELLGLDSKTTTQIPTAEDSTKVCSPETYCGAARNNRLFNGLSGALGVQTFVAPSDFPADVLVLDGPWDIQDEYAKPLDNNSRVLFKYHAADVFLVAKAEQSTTVTVKRDGYALPASLTGEDVSMSSGVAKLQLQEDRLYSVISGDDNQDHILELIFESAVDNVEVYTLTFGK